MTQTEFEDFVYQWITGAMPDQVIFAFDNGARPETNYISINVYLFRDLSTVAEKYTVEDNDTITIEFSKLIEATVSIHVYYNDAFDRADKLKNSLDTYSVKEFFRGNNIGFSSSTTINKLREEIKKKFENRAQFDLVFNIRSSETEALEKIDKVSMTNNIDGYETIIQQ